MVSQVAQEELSQILQDLRQALRVAAFSEIRKISDKLEMASEMFIHQSSTLKDQKFIEFEIDRIQNLISSSMNGVQSARRKVQLYGKPKADFVTYSPTSKIIKG